MEEDDIARENGRRTSGKVFAKKEEDVITLGRWVNFGHHGA